jgi:hypothetical protein
MQSAGVRDFLITIGISGVLALGYMLAIWKSDRTAVGRALTRYHEFWAKGSVSLSARLQIWVVGIVMLLISVGAAVALIVRLSGGQLK